MTLPKSNQMSKNHLIIVIIFCGLVALGSYLIGNHFTKDLTNEDITFDDCENLVNWLEKQRHWNMEEPQSVNQFFAKDMWTERQEIAKKLGCF